jgi:hypothetical protein
MQFSNIMTKTNLVFNEQKTNNKRVQLVFPKSKGTDVHLPNDLSKYSGKDFFQLYCADTSEVAGGLMTSPPTRSNCGSIV